jgi:hypothetical protein
MQTRHDFDLPDGIPCTCDACVIADGLGEVARALIQLGNADASTPMGGLEGLGKALSDSLDNVAGALDGVGNAIFEHE